MFLLNIPSVEARHSSENPPACLTASVRNNVLSILYTHFGMSLALYCHVSIACIVLLPLYNLTPCTAPTFGSDRITFEVRRNHSGFKIMSCSNDANVPVSTLLRARLAW